MRRVLFELIASLRSATWQEAIEFAYWAVVTACAAWIVLRWLAAKWKFGFSRRRRTDPRCARCGYILGRGCSVVCAECGSDVREVGIVTPSTPPATGVGPAVWYVLAALAPLPVAQFLGYVSARWQPFGWDYQALWVSELNTARPGTAAGTTHRFLVNVHGTGRHFGRRPMAVALHHRAVVGGVPYFGTADQWVTAPDWTYVERDSNGTPRDYVRFDRHAADHWVENAAPDAPPAEQARVASEIEAHFAAAIRGDLPPSAGTPRPGVPGLGRPGVMIRYDVRPAPIHVMGLICYVPLACAAVWAMRRFRVRHQRRRRAEWLRAAEQLELSVAAPAGTQPGQAAAGHRPCGARTLPNATAQSVR